MKRYASPQAGTFEPPFPVYGRTGGRFISPKAPAKAAIRRVKLHDGDTITRDASGQYWAEFSDPHGMLGQTFGCRPGALRKVMIDAAAALMGSPQNSEKIVR